MDDHDDDDDSMIVTYCNYTIADDGDGHMRFLSRRMSELELSSATRTRYVFRKVIEYLE